jgi:PH domain
MKTVEVAGVKIERKRGPNEDGDLQPQEKHLRQAFMYAVRFNSKPALATIVNLDIGNRVAQYIGVNPNDPSGHTSVLQEHKIVGSKVSPDLLYKNQLHVWYKGEKKPVDHTTWGEDYRDTMLDTLKLRTHPDVEIVCVHEGAVALREKDAWTFLFARYDPHWVRLINGAAVIYSSEEQLHPMDVICLIGGTVRFGKKDAKIFKLKSDERQYYFKCETEEECDKWLDALEIARARGAHERQLVRQHLVFHKYQAKLHRKNRHHSGVRHSDSRSFADSMSSDNGSRNFSRETLARGYRIDELRPDSDSDASVASHMSTVSDYDGRRRSRRRSRSHSRRSSKKKRKQKRLRVRDDDDTKSSISTISTLSLPQVYRGGDADVTVFMEAPDKTVNRVGVIEIHGDSPLSVFRQKIIQELDDIPLDFVYLRAGVPIGRRQEGNKTIGYVVVNQKVTLRAIVPKRAKPKRVKMASNHRNNSDGNS